MFVVAGATGNTGKIVAETLLEEGKSVRLIVRDPSKAAAFKDRGAEIATASLDDATALAEAFRGARGAFLLIPPPGFQATGILASRRKIIAAVSEALAGSSVRHVVLLSSLGAQHAEGTGIIETAYLAEQALRKLSIATTFVRPGFFMENLYGSLEPVLKNDTLYSMTDPERTIPMVATRDIGVTAAHALLNAQEGNNVIDLAGPQDYSNNDVADTFGRLLGKKITVAFLPREARVGAMTSMGMSKEMAELYAGMYEGFEAGKLTWEADTAKHVRGKIALDQFVGGLQGRDEGLSDRLTIVKGQAAPIGSIPRGRAP